MASDPSLEPLLLEQKLQPRHVSGTSSGWLGISSQDGSVFAICVHNAKRLAAELLKGRLPWHYRATHRANSHHSKTNIS
eukprot:4269666-Amphidinium_carterae.1